MIRTGTEFWWLRSKYFMKINGFVRVLEKQGHEGWKKNLSEMAGLFHKAEYEMVKRGHRTAAIIHINENNYLEMTEKMNKDGLVFTPFLKSGYYQGFSHQHKPVKEGEPYYWYGSLTRTNKEGEIFKEANKKSDHMAYGKFLGYPECCSEYFVNNFSSNYDPIWLNKEGNIDGYPEANQMLRYFGARITSHFSCSPTCKKTKEVGEIWFEVMKSINEKTALELYKLLSEKIEWNSYHGVVSVETPYFVGVTHTYPLIEKPRVLKWSNGNTK